jgi:hypothetical protein
MPVVENPWQGGRARCGLTTILCDAIYTTFGLTSASTTVVSRNETRDRCVLCGITFAMFFDQDDGEWKYRNCKEMNVDQDDGPTVVGIGTRHVLGQDSVVLTFSRRTRLGIDCRWGHLTTRRCPIYTSTPDVHIAL